MTMPTAFNFFRVNNRLLKISQERKELVNKINLLRTFLNKTKDYHPPQGAKATPEPDLNPKQMDYYLAYFLRKYVLTQEMIVLAPHQVAKNPQIVASTQRQAFQKISGEAGLVKLATIIKQLVENNFESHQLGGLDLLIAKTLSQSPLKEMIKYFAATSAYSDVPKIINRAEKKINTLSNKEDAIRLRVISSSPVALGA